MHPLPLTVPVAANSGLRKNATVPTGHGNYSGKSLPFIQFYLHKNTNEELCANCLLLLRLIKRSKISKHLWIPFTHTCSHSLVWRDTGHGNSVSGSLVRKASSKGSLQGTVRERKHTCKWGSEPYSGELWKKFILIFYRATFKIKWLISFSSRHWNILLNSW